MPQLANVVLYGGIALLIVGAAGLLYARRRPVLTPVQGPVLTRVRRASTSDPPQTNQQQKRGGHQTARPFTYPHDKHPLTPHTPTPYHKHRSRQGTDPSGSPLPFLFSL